MTKEKLEQANDLQEVAREMSIIEETLRDGRVDHIRVGNSGNNLTMLIVGENAKLVLEKMIAAGISAAMSVRAAAENDLEKL